MATPERAPRWDEQVQRRLARGEETALGELYDQLAPMVHGLAGRILADQAAAAQLTREIFAHVWEHPEDFDPARGTLRSWLGALTHRRAVDRLRARRAAEHPADGDPLGAEAEIRAVATAARMRYVVDSLPQPLRETIAVTYYDGRTYRETARLLGISEQAAKQRMRLGLELLATELADEPTDEPADEGARQDQAGDQADEQAGDQAGDRAEDRAGDGKT
ncbi:sigma-70 family RNA polymerase sigma factor [Streptomyces sp. NRRL S-350]|uniref:sigma-70 family RNA polymerase sigma factor n=1 Tax=Streptomyces sp. NRRL S-350 TaxID=1463902 RepID=UPI0007C5C9B2|nr:sigma-70 family RNA polymerase sigma factor [Streptomyces sp. NRRL S-350]